METYYAKISVKYSFAYIEDGSLGINAELEVVDTNVPAPIYGLPLFEEEEYYYHRISLHGSRHEIGKLVEEALERARREFLRIVGDLLSKEFKDTEVVFTA